MSPAETPKSKKRVAVGNKILSRRQQLMFSKKLSELEAIERELQRRTNLTNPMVYGLPDLLFGKDEEPGVLNESTGEVERQIRAIPESDDEYRERQNAAVKNIIETHLHFTKDGRQIDIRFIDKQVAFISDFFFGRVKRGILWKGRGCLTPENLVVSNRGLIPISKLTADDLVINRDGRLTEVVDVVPRKYRGKIVRLEINGNGQKLGFTPDHLVLGIRTSRCNQKEGNCGRTVCTNLCTRSCPNRFWETYREDWIEAGSLRKGDLVFVPSPVTNPEARNISFSGCANQHWTGSCSFPMNDEFFRLLGYWLAEGDAHVPGRRVRLAFESGKDDRFIADAVQIVDALMGLKAGIEEDGRKKSVIIHSAGLAKVLSSFGKVRSKGVPLQFLSKASNSQLRNLVVGMLRGDGHWDGTSIRASWCSPLVAADFMYACWRLGFTPSCRIVEGQDREGFLVNRSGDQFYLQIGGHPGRELAKLAWEVDAAPLQNDPMNTQRRWFREGKVFSRVDKVSTEDYDGDVWDIEVAEGSSFCLPYLVAHNCGGSLCAAILIWLTMIYKNMSFIDLGGSMEQSRVVYEYVCAFWDCIPNMRERLLSKDPLISMTKLITGVQLKCIVPGTLVLTDRGIIPVESVVVGDRVIAGDGRFSSVKMTITRRHRGDVVRVVPVGYGRGFETTLDHQIWAMKVARPVRHALQRGEAVDEIPKADWIEAQDLEIGDVLPVPKLRTDPSPKTLILEDLRSRRRGPKPLISIPITPDFYRLLGYVLADGSSHKQWINIAFGDHETANIDDCVRLVRSCLDRKACVLSRPDKAIKIVHFSFMAFAQWLRDNCGKREEKELPLWLLEQATDIEIREFVVGAVRGDGGFNESVSESGTKRKMQFTNTSSKLTQSVMLACHRLGLVGGLILPKSRKSTIRGKEFVSKQQYNWQITGTACDQLATMLGQEWKSEKSKSFQQGWHDDTHVYRPIKKIERRQYDGPVVDLVIDGHPSFTLPGALVHNCIPASEKMARGKHLPGLVADEASIVPGTLIWTRRGVVPIETIVTDDIVLAADGQWRKVVATTSHPYSGKIVKLTGCGDGIGAWITEEHRVFGATGIGVTRVLNDRVYASFDTALPSSDWHRAWDYDVGDVLSYPRPQRVGNLPEFLVSGDPQLWRFLGYWCGDGGAPVTKTDNYPIKLHLGTAKSFFVDDAIDCMSHALDRRVRTETCPSRPNSIDLVVSSCKEWWERLRNLVGMQDDRGIPLEWLEAASDDDLRNFMIGLLRTDGGPAFRPDGVLSKWSWTGTSQHLAANVMYCTSRLGIPASVGTRGSARHGIPSKPQWDVHIRWDYAKKILLDEDVEGMRLPTKAVNPKQWCDESLWHSVITKIDEDHYEGTVYDLQVEGNPSFGCLQRLMLHNCQNDINADTTFKAAMQMSMSEPDHMILLLSTFHHPVGLFQEVWDTAESKGFARYKWNCVLPDTWMLTSSGFRQAKSVIAGDSVLSEDGNFHLVERSWSQTSAKDVVKVVPYGWFTGFEVTHDHKLLVMRDGTRQWITADALRAESDLLVFPTGHLSDAIQKVNLSYEDARFASDRVDQVLDMTPDLARLVGYWLGDGCLDGEKVVASFGDPEKYKDDYIALVKSLFSRTVTVDKDVPNERGQFQHRGFVKWLSENARDENGAKGLSWSIFNSLTREAAEQLVIGLLRTAGNVSLHRNNALKVSFGQVSQLLSQQMFMLLARLGYHPSLGRRKQRDSVYNDRVISGDDYWEIYVNGDGACSLAELLGMTFREARSVRAKFKIVGDEQLVRIRKIERRSYVGPVFDFAVRDVHSFAFPWAIAHNCFDVMKTCDAGLDGATPEDPDALTFCQTSCPLTVKEPLYDENDQLIGHRFNGCNGTSRHSNGFLPRDNVINALVLNEGSEIFRVEFACERPQFSGPIYGLAAIENALTDEMEIDDTETTLVGIDWGVTEGSLVLGKDSVANGPQVIETKFLSVKLVSEYIKVLSDWQDEYGKLEIYADSSHQFNIGDLEEVGFEVTPIDFATMKEYGIGNLLKMFMYGKIKILDDNTHLVDQLKSYRKDPKTGKPIKINDHGPDALLCMTITIDFLERWSDLITARAQGITRNKVLKTMNELGIQSDSNVDEKPVDRDSGVMIF